MTNQHRIPLVLTGALLLSQAVLAQAVSVVSPPRALTTEGSTGNKMPFGDGQPQRYLQIHSDLGTSAMTIRRLDFRMDAEASSPTYSGVTTLDVAMRIGRTRPWNGIVRNLDGNWLAAPTTVMNRQIVNWGPQGQNGPGPRPFTSNMGLALQTPYAYPGNQSLGWEVTVYQATIASSFQIFADTDSNRYTFLSGSALGTGCTATGRSAAMALSPYAAVHGAYFLFGPGITNGPSLAPTILALGSQDPDLLVPGLCSNLRTDLLVTLPLDNTDATGRINGTFGAFYYFPAPSLGGTLYMQAHSLDLNSSYAIKISSTEGRVVQLVPPHSSDVPVSRLSTLTAGPGGTTTAFFPFATMGQGLVTRFSN